jgi:hypothetical protein
MSMSNQIQNTGRWSYYEINYSRTLQHQDDYLDAMTLAEKVSSAAKVALYAIVETFQNLAALIANGAIALGNAFHRTYTPTESKQVLADEDVQSDTSSTVTLEDLPSPRHVTFKEPLEEKRLIVEDSESDTTSLNLEEELNDARTVRIGEFTQHPSKERLVTERQLLEEFVALIAPKKEVDIDLTEILPVNLTPEDIQPKEILLTERQLQEQVVELAAPKKEVDIDLAEVLPIHLTPEDIQPEADVVLEDIFAADKVELEDIFNPENEQPREVPPVRSYRERFHAAVSQILSHRS